MQQCPEKNTEGERDLQPSHHRFMPWGLGDANAIQLRLSQPYWLSRQPDQITDPGVVLPPT